MEFRDSLREEIQYQGITLKELAEKSNISKRTIESYVDSRGRMPTAENAVKIAKALNVTVEYLVTGNDLNTKKEIDHSSLQKTIKEMLSIPDEHLKPIKEIIHNTAELIKKESPTYSYKEKNL